MGDRGHVELLTRSVRLAVDSASGDGGPFAALIVTADGRVFEGVNRVTAQLDPTAHAEVVAIRVACQALGTFDLTGCVLYASCEPCPMCLASALWARVDHVYFAADRHDAAEVGFDDAAFYRYFDGIDRSLLPVEALALPQRREPFEAWRANTARIEY